MVITAAHIPAIVALIAGILILIMPRLLNFIVAIYLIFVGLVGMGMGMKTARLSGADGAPLDPELQEALRAPPLPQYSTKPPAYDISLSLEANPLDDLKAPSAQTPVKVSGAHRDGFSFKTSSLFFGSSLGAPETIERWQPGEEPTIVTANAPSDPDMSIRKAFPIVSAITAADASRARCELATIPIPSSSTPNISQAIEYVYCSASVSAPRLITGPW